LQDWLAQELHIKYQVPTKLAQAWIGQEHILPLLDGLDEVAQDNRVDCVRAINAYRETYGLVPVVVCCRSADYFSQSARLLLNRAIEVLLITIIECLMGGALTAWLKGGLKNGVVGSGGITA